MSDPRPLRPEIAASWARSAQSGVRPDRPDPAAADDVAVGGRLSTLATPVLDRLGRHLDDARATLVLTDARARVLDRRAGRAGLNDTLDEVGLVPGHSYAEDAVGTNGMGTAAEERRAVTVIGDEHYAEALRGLTCVGVPVVHPVTGRLEGIVDLTCFNDDAGSWMTPLAMEVAHAVESRLEEAATHTEQALLSAFMARSRRTTTPIVAVTADIVLTNPAAARLLAPQDHQQLWEVVAGLGSTELAAEVALADGSSFRARFEPVEVGRLTAGAVIALDRIGDDVPPPVPRRHRRSATSAPAGPLASHGAAMHGGAIDHAHDAPPDAAARVGSSPAWRRAARELSEALAEGTTTLLSGPSGSGKLTLARGQVPDAVVLDATRAVIDGPRAWLQVAAAHLARPVPVIARRVDLLDAATAMGLATLLQSDPAARVVATAVDGAGEPGLLHGFGRVVAVPGLDARHDDLPDLVRSLLGRMLPSEPPSIAPEALQALARAEWPGQVRQLDQVLRQAVARALGRRSQGRILLDDLPASVRAVAHRRRLTPREQRDCQAITTALADADGNKVLAAELLGMSRSTLYRKMSAFGLDLDRRAY